MVNLLLSIFSGALTFAAFKPIGLWWLAPIGLALHIFVLHRTDRKLLSTLLFALTLNLSLLHWTSSYVGVRPWLILAIGISLFYLPLALVKYWGIACYPLIFILLEEVRNRFPFQGFGWARIAYSQADSPLAIVARYGGASALSTMVVTVALFLAFLAIKDFQPLLLLPLVLLLFPVTVNQNLSIKAYLIQGDVPSYGLDFNARAQQVFNNHLKLTQSVIKTDPQIDFILWPENAVDVDPFANKKVFNALESFDLPLIVGAIVKENNKLFNTSILWGATSQQIYRKRHLTPFGEYIPWRSIARKISPLVDQVHDFSPGSSAEIFRIGQGRIAPIICYEVLDDGIVAAAAKRANLLVVQTNNATFGTSAQSDQQLSITRIRAIEHSRNILSVSTTGYSAVIDYRGAVLERTAMGKADYLTATVGLLSKLSPNDRLGGWALALTVFWLLWIWRWRRG